MLDMPRGHAPPGEWTIATAKDHLEQRIDAGDQLLRDHIFQQIGQVAAALDAARRETELAGHAQDTAIAKSEAATERRFDGVNAFREQLAEQASTFVRREVADAQFASLLAKIEALQTRMDRQTGEGLARAKSDATNLSWKIAGSGFAVTIIVVIIGLATGGHV